MAVNPIPTGYHSITPSVVVDDAAKALDFYRDALGASAIRASCCPTNTPTGMR